MEFVMRAIIAIAVVCGSVSAWTRPKCGTPNSGQDIITEWGMSFSSEIWVDSIGLQNNSHVILCLTLSDRENHRSDETGASGVPAATNDPSCRYL